MLIIIDRKMTESKRIGISIMLEHRLAKMTYYLFLNTLSLEMRPFNLMVEKKNKKIFPKAAFFSLL